MNLFYGQEYMVFKLIDRFLTEATLVQILRKFTALNTLKKIMAKIWIRYVECFNYLEEFILFN